MIEKFEFVHRLGSWYLWNESFVDRWHYIGEEISDCLMYAQNWFMDIEALIPDFKLNVEFQINVSFSYEIISDQ